MSYGCVNKMTESKEEPAEEKPSLFWSIFIVAGANIIIACAFFIRSIYSLHVLGALGLIDCLLVFFVFLGMKRHAQTKDKEVSATTFSRKMFNIISGLLFAFFIWLFSPFLAFFILFGVDFAFGFHEFVYAVLKKKTYFTDAFNGLGRQSEPFKPYLASIMALLGFTIVLTFQTLLFQYFGIPNLSNVVIIVYVATILIWGIGDTAAYFAGTRYGKHKLPYNKKKSWEGFIANMAVGIGIGIIFFSPFMLPFMNTIWWILIAICGGLAGAFFESIDIHLDDNFVAVTFSGLLIGCLIILIYLL